MCSVIDPQTLFHLTRSCAEKHAGQIGYTFLVDGEAEELNLTYAELAPNAKRGRSIDFRL
jgi:hypothetical protein